MSRHMEEVLGCSVCEIGRQSGVNNVEVTPSDNSKEGFEWEEYKQVLQALVLELSSGYWRFCSHC